MGRIDGLYLVCIHRLGIPKYSSLIIEENFSGHHHLEIHLLIDHSTQISIEKSELDDEKKGIDNTKRKMGSTGEKYAGDAREKSKNRDNKEENQKKNRLIEEIHKCFIGMLTLCNRKIDIFHIGFIPLNSTKTPYIYGDDYEPPDDIQTQECRDGNGYGIGIYLSKYKEIDIDAGDNNHKKYPPRDDNGIYPVFFNNHNETISIFFEFLEKLRITTYIEGFKHPGHDTAEIDEHRKGV